MRSDCARSAWRESHSTRGSSSRSVQLASAPLFPDPALPATRHVDGARDGAYGRPSKEVAWTSPAAPFPYPSAPAGSRTPAQPFTSRSAIASVGSEGGGGVASEPGCTTGLPVKGSIFTFGFGGAPPLC